jgi:hypothetical protein
VILVQLGKYGLHPPPRAESGTDHLAMLLMFGQLPIMASLLLAGRRELRRVAPVLGLQVLLWAVVFAAARLT